MIKYIFTGLFLFLMAGLFAQPGQNFIFNPQESSELLKLNDAFDRKFEKVADSFLQGYTLIYRLPPTGLDNSWDLWLRRDSTAIIMLRSTTRDPKSIAADFYCAMSPAEGSIILDSNDTLHYKLAAHPQAAVHGGFLIGFAYLDQSIRTKMDSLYAAGYRKFIIAGHSQGGALCYLLSASLFYLQQDGYYKNAIIKTYASGSPKVGNTYFGYDYDNTMRYNITYSITNSEDPVPPMPLTTQQLSDVTEPNPVTLLLASANKMSFFKRIILKGAINRMKRRATRSAQSYQKYLGKYSGKMVKSMVPGLVLPPTVNTTYFVRPGVPVSLVVDVGFKNQYKNYMQKKSYSDHSPLTYRYLLQYNFPGQMSTILDQ